MTALAEWDPAADAWASGFIDGEGTFNIVQARAGLALNPRFSVGLRVDELPILRRLQDAFGGTVQLKSAVGAAHPVAHLNLIAKADLRRICDYLDRFPLRAKKARDYAVWREAVAVYERSGWRAPELSVLREELQGGRVFVAPGFEADGAAAVRALVPEGAG